jgi:hypothetical protein
VDLDLSDVPGLRVVSGAHRRLRRPGDRRQGAHRPPAPVAHVAPPRRHRARGRPRPGGALPPPRRGSALREVAGPPPAALRAGRRPRRAHRPRGGRRRAHPLRADSRCWTAVPGWTSS